MNFQISCENVVPETINTNEWVDESQCGTRHANLNEKDFADLCIRRARPIRFNSLRLTCHSCCCLLLRGFLLMERWNLPATSVRVRQMRNYGGQPPEPSCFKQHQDFSHDRQQRHCTPTSTDATSTYTTWATGTRTVLAVPGTALMVSSSNTPQHSQPYRMLRLIPLSDTN